MHTCICVSSSVNKTFVGENGSTGTVESAAAQPDGNCEVSISSRTAHIPTEFVAAQAEWDAVETVTPGKPSSHFYYIFY